MNSLDVCSWNIEDAFVSSYRCKIDEYQKPLSTTTITTNPLMTPIILLLLAYGWSIVSSYVLSYMRRCKWLKGGDDTKKYEKTISDISKNIVHFINAFICVSTMHPSVLYNTDAFYHRQIVNFGILASVAFYLYDTVRLVQGFQTANVAYIIHHVTTISWLYYAWTDYHRQLILYAVYLLEYSNFMLYVSYHILKAYPTHKVLQTVSECFQFVWYGYFRTIRLTIHLYQVQEALFTEVFRSVSLTLMFIIMYTMGIYWTYNLYRKCVRLLSLAK